MLVRRQSQLFRASAVNQSLVKKDNSIGLQCLLSEPDLVCPITGRDQRAHAARANCTANVSELIAIGVCHPVCSLPPGISHSCFWRLSI